MKGAEVTCDQKKSQNGLHKIQHLTPQSPDFEIEYALMSCRGQPPASWHHWEV